MNAEIMAYVLLAAVANVAGGFIIYIKKDWSNRSMVALMALSAGLLLSIAILDLMPKVVGDNHYSPLFILIGMMMIFSIQQFGTRHTHIDTSESYTVQGTITGSMIGMFIHTFFDGFAIAAGFELDLQLGVTVLVALLLHKIPDGMTMSSIIYALTGNRRKAVGATVVMAVATIIGAIFAWVLIGGALPDENMLALALSLSCGIFLYVAGTDLLPAIHAAHDRFLAVFVIVGIMIYFLLQWGVAQLGLPGH